jgi:hypothetical protein
MEGKVDKVLVRNHVLGYLQTPQREQEALQLMRRMLDVREEMKRLFHEDQLVLLGGRADTQVSWHTSEASQQSELHNCFSELFIKFPEIESLYSTSKTFSL